MTASVNPMIPQWYTILSLSIASGSSLKIAMPVCALNRPANKRGPVNGENGEFEGLREDNELKPYG
jgi:hypothetical protein